MIMQKGIRPLLDGVTQPVMANSSGPLFTDIPSSESALLAAFFVATNGDSWIDKDGWDGPLAALATGISITDGHVTGIELPGNNLNGNPGANIPVSVEVLDLGQNENMAMPDLSGNIVLDTVDLADCNRSISEVVAVLEDLDESGITGATIDVGGSDADYANSSPDPAGIEYIESLLDKSCNLSYNSIVKFAPSGTLHIATKDGESMLFDDSDDYSPYAGTDGGATGYYVVIKDYVGKYASGYSGAIGGGETLGAELISPIDLTNGWVTSNATISDANTFVTTAAFGLVAKPSFFTVGKLYKASMTTTDDGGVTRMLSLSYVIGQDDFTDEYVTAPSDQIRFNNSVTGITVDIDSVTIKELTDVPATGIHLMSASDGTTRNLESIESGFASNGVTQVEIFPSGQ